jgi:hypothetical protein
MSTLRSFAIGALASGGTWLIVFHVASFFVADSTTYKLNPVDWDGIGAVMSGLGAIATFVAAWSAYSASKSAESLSKQIAEEARQQRVRRALQAKLLTREELDIAIARANAAKEVLERAQPDSVSRAVALLRKIRLPQTERCVLEADLFDPLLATYFTITLSSLRKIVEIFDSGNGIQAHKQPDSQELLSALTGHFINDAVLAKTTAQQEFLASGTQHDRT